MTSTEARRSRARILVGCSGWSYPHWGKAFYPPGLPSNAWLEHYSSIFDTVEVNATFYRLPAAKTVTRWAETTPDGFCFAVKASRYLTHVKRLRDLRSGVERFFDRLQPLVEERKLGPVLWQLPQTFHRDDGALGEALEILPEGRHCFEFRHESWFAEPVYHLLRVADAALVVADARGQPLRAESTADWTYVRFHRGRGRDGNYSAAQLRKWAERLPTLARTGFAYFNNDWNAFAVRNAVELVRLLDLPARDDRL